MNAQRIFDRVHGNIRLLPLAAHIAATPEFHRLDGIRQLGGTSFVYPSATHTRREHSIGVCYLAEAMATHLQKLHSEYVNADDVLCVAVAGLVHDLGHGPFSHLFEDYMREHEPTWSHERVGLLLFRRLLARHPEMKLDTCFESDVETNLAFVELLVTGLGTAEPWPAERVGRTEDKRFLVDIVHNQRHGIDVDKLDYLARDAQAVFGSVQLFNVDRIISASRLVRCEDGTLSLSFDEKVAFELVEVYALRSRLHRQVYQHRSVLVVEELLKDVLRRTKLHQQALNLESFLTLVDASVLFSGSTERLYERPWFARVPVTASLNTRPRCVYCRSVTGIKDAVCGVCGECTLWRTYSLDSQGLRYSKDLDVTAETLTLAMQTQLQTSDVWVHVTDIKNGSPIRVVDAHGYEWRDHCPISNVLLSKNNTTAFYPTPSDDLHQIPSTRHVRTAYCYLSCVATPKELEHAAYIFRQTTRRMCNAEFTDTSCDMD